jgi:hypothetical protein
MWLKGALRLPIETVEVFKKWAWRPGASDERFNEAELWVDVKKLPCKVEWSQCP